MSLQASAMPMPLTLNTSSSRAANAAARNFERNLAAISNTQPRIANAAQAAAIDLEWLFGRDGSLTARDRLGKWWSGCSLPRRAAKAVLKPMDASGRVVCFLAPTHAAQVRVALQTLVSNQALIAIGVDEASLPVMLHCEDFSDEIAAHRLWLAWGPNWTENLERLFDERPGLAAPAQFIRAGGADTSAADNLIPPAQKIFRAVSERRLNLIRQHCEAGRESDIAGKVCVIAPSHFRLWDDSGRILGNIVRDGTELEAIAFDGDNPLSASSLALAEVASKCDAIVAPGIARADLPDVAHPQTPWITWVVTPRIPPFASAGPRDALLVADPAWKKAAVDGGWPDDRVEIGGWPAVDESTTLRTPPRGDVEIVSPSPSTLGEASGIGDCPRADCGAGLPRTVKNGPHPNPFPGCREREKFIALIVDTRPIEIPRVVEDFSSHRLLWEFAQNELLNDPLRVIEGIDAYLSEAMRCFQIAEHGFDPRIFVERLIVPAYQQGLARMMIDAGLPVRLWGAGWDRIQEFQSHREGPVASRESLARIVGQAMAIVHPLPGGAAHPIDGFGGAVIRPAESGKNFIALCRMAMVGKNFDPAPKCDVITGKKIAELIRRSGFDPTPAPTRTRTKTGYE